MITILTPSKTMDFTSEPPTYAQPSVPAFANEALRIRKHLAGYTADEVKVLMNVSDNLARKTSELYGKTAVKPAFWAYDGDVFKGVQARTLDENDAIFAQRHVLVPSAVYGLVRPFDEISPYRLEMKAKLAVGTAKNLYEFWGGKLGGYINQCADGEVLMLSSHEYARSILPHLAKETRVVTPAFIDRKPNGQESQVAIYNKMMRGVMARWVIDNKVNSLHEIVTFAAHGYTYDAKRSTDTKPVFYRLQMTPLRF